MLVSFSCEHFNFLKSFARVTRIWFHTTVPL